MQHAKDECLFCQMVQGKIPAKIIYEDENVLAFQDINPLAAVHLLFIHKKHTENVLDMVQQEVKQVVDIFSSINQVAKNLGLDRKGVRLVTNVGKSAGQSIFHTHFHLLSDKVLGPFV